MSVMWPVNGIQASLLASLDTSQRSISATAAVAVTFTRYNDGETSGAIVGSICARPTDLPLVFHPNRDQSPVAILPIDAVPDQRKLTTKEHHGGWARLNVNPGNVCDPAPNINRVTCLARSAIYEMSSGYNVI